VAAECFDEITPTLILIADTNCSRPDFALQDECPVLHPSRPPRLPILTSSNLPVCLTPGHRSHRPIPIPSPMSLPLPFRAPAYPCARFPPKPVTVVGIQDKGRRAAACSRTFRDVSALRRTPARYDAFARVHWSLTCDASQPGPDTPKCVHHSTTGCAHAKSPLASEPTRISFARHA